MVFQQLNRTDAEKVFGIFTNAEGATLPAGAWVQLDVSTAIDGNRIVQPNTNELALGLGFLDASLASTATQARVQIYGYKSDAVVLRTDTSMAVGIEMIGVAGANYVSSGGAGTQGEGWVELCETVASSSASATLSAKVFVRAM